VSARSKGKPLSQVQFWLVVVTMALSGVAALVVLANVAGPHGTCPTQSQITRAVASHCSPAYENQIKSGVVG
jgi:hypothetical protein